MKRLKVLRRKVGRAVPSAPRSPAQRRRGEDTAPHRSRAFTIIEVMLAIGIFMMVILSIYSVWTGILKASKAAHDAANNAQRARVAMRAVEDALTTAQMFTANMPPQNQVAYYSFLGDMKGDYGSLSFVAHLPATFPGVGRFGDHVVRRVTFTVEPEKDGTLSLVMRQGPVLMAADPDFEPYSLVLAKDVQMFGFEFWGQDDPIRRPNDWGWIDHWDSTNSLPSLVRVGLALGKTSRRDESQNLVVKVVALPAKAVQPEWQNPMGAGGVPGRPGPGGRPGQPAGQPGTINRAGPGGMPIR
jgi:type II secretory pathway pseudopilin PulG